MTIKARPCVRCGVEIPVERIEALPETWLCIKCSQTVGGDFEVFVTQTSLGKTGSLKKNYGDYSVKKRRRRIQPLEE
jgi:ribosomal protein L37AE/L43A